MLDINNISYKNNKTWKLIQSGLTCGVFQLETNLGSHWAKKIGPSNVSELSAIISLIRPGGLASGLIEEYSKIKNKEKKPLIINDPVIDKILAPTYGILLYQEQVLAIAQEVAWAHLPKLERLVKSDSLRRGIGKKLAKVIFDLRKDFVEGCIINGRSRGLAEKIFNIIEKSARYSFNAAHSYKYAHFTYKTAYLKANYPLEFYATYLTYSKFKMKSQIEISRLVDEAKLLNIHIVPPNILEQNGEFKILNGGKKTIGYGLSHIKYVGKNDMEIIKNNKIDTPVKLLSAHFVGYNEVKFREQAVKSLISCGACDSYKIPRRMLLSVFILLKHLTKGRELPFVLAALEKANDIYKLPEILEDCAGQKSTKNRKDIVRSEASQLDLKIQDTYTWKANQEKSILGIALTCSQMDDQNIITKTNCKDCHKMASRGNNGVKAQISGVLEGYKKLITKKGKNPGQEMAILNIRDKSGSLRVACFPQHFSLYEYGLHENVSYELELEGTGDGWCIKQLEQI